MDHERGNNQFHDGDSESDDLYDLYSICNGRLYNGVLDLRPLDRLSQEEKDLFDVARLKRLGAHVVAGCAECGAIINMLNMARAALRGEGAEVRRAGVDSFSEQAEALDANHSDSRWKH